MGRIYLAVIGMAVLAVQVGWADAGTPVTVSSEGWTVNGDGQQRIISISYENLGTILKDVRLNLRGQHGLQQLKGWSVGKVGEKGLSIHTAEPRTLWAIKLDPEALTISTTTAEAPATQDRIVARFLDPQGVPASRAFFCGQARSGSRGFLCRFRFLGAEASGGVQRQDGSDD